MRELNKPRLLKKLKACNGRKDRTGRNLRQSAASVSELRWSGRTGESLLKDRGVVVEGEGTPTCCCKQEGISWCVEVSHVKFHLVYHLV